MKNKVEKFWQSFQAKPVEPPQEKREMLKATELKLGDYNPKFKITIEK